jgi:aryl-alcohol dehydrogenase (NADP+)
MAAWEFASLLFLADKNGFHRFVSMQNHYNLVYREEEREMIPLCLSEGVGLIPWSPLARGFLAGTRKREGKGPTARAESDPFADDMYFKDEDWDVVDSLVAVAKEVGKKPAQVALAWLLSVPGVDAPIVGTTKLEQLEELAEAVDLKLGDEHIQKLEKPYRPHPVLGHKQRTPRELGRK